MTQLARVLSRLQQDLKQLAAEWAIVGGIAVSLRSRPRTTFDIDVAVAVESDREAEALVRELRHRGYMEQPFLLEQEATGRLATVRLLPPQDVGSSPIDLLFASSGIEPEIVRAAEVLEALPGMKLPVARGGHLLALKILAGRTQDRVDAVTLLQAAPFEDRALALDALQKIERRGFNRGRKNLQQDLADLIARCEDRES